MEIFSVGHSNHSIETFISLLQKHNITAVADVRSHPYSRYLPHFNQSPLQKALSKVGINYVFLGRELGARPEDLSCYDLQGKALYERIAATSLFLAGIQRLIQGAEKYTIALMCAEKDPITCHRTILVCRHLRQFNFQINHILPEGNLETHSQLEERLLAKFNQSNHQPVQLSFLETSSQSQVKVINLEDAYQKQGNEIAYTIKKIKLFTIGFTQKTAQEFFEILSNSRIKRVIDSRLNNSSQLAGFTKHKDLEYFLKIIANIDYIHLRELAPTQELLNEYKKNGKNWETYEQQFLKLMSDRQVEKKVSPELLDNSCLLCSEATPKYCHRRLVAEYLNIKWGNIEIHHL